MDTRNITEKEFEDAVERLLISKGGYKSAKPADYNKKKALFFDTLISFIQTTQEQQWNSFVKAYGSRAEQEFFSIFDKATREKGILHVLKNGIRSIDANFKVCFFKVHNPHNTTADERYKLNQWHVVRQFAYSEHNHKTVDVVLTLNGIPLIAIELKNHSTGQTIENAINQWKEDRDCNETVFQFNRRILAFFAVDPCEAAITTKLEGANTFFIPYNQGSNGAGAVGGKGNPQAPDDKFMVHYLWEEVLQTDKLLEIIDNYVTLETTGTKSEKGGKSSSYKMNKLANKRLIFPRYHQLDVVRKLLSHSEEHGAGHNYLIMHSAGSGKSNSIAWLAHQLTRVFDKKGEPLFNNILVVTDRRVLNNQLGATVNKQSDVRGVVSLINQNVSSAQFKNMLNGNEAKIFITTIQRFPLIYKEVVGTAGKNYAIIIDEAHSSQSGEASKALKKALADISELGADELRDEEHTEEPQDLLEQRLYDEIKAQGQHRNLSFFAFTATPKPITLAMFGELVEQGETQESNKYAPFHTYSMLQAIEEGFILDVLKKYTPISVWCKVMNTSDKNPTVDEQKALKAIERFKNNDANIVAKKVELMATLLEQYTVNKLEGKAKAMIVTSSRALALRYYFELRQYCKDNGLNAIRPLVAFTDKLKYKGEEYTESKANSIDGVKITENGLPKVFAGPDYNVLIVADKYLTGFDEPLLHTMIVDKRLGGVKAVQTLSRLNRARKGKYETMIFDFVNSADDIQAAFEPYYSGIELVKSYNPNDIYELKEQLLEYELCTPQEERQVAEVYLKAIDGVIVDGIAAISKAIQSSKKNFEALTKDEKELVRNLAKKYVKMYEQISSLRRITDEGLLITYYWLLNLLKYITIDREKPISINEILMVKDIKVKVGATKTISLGEETTNTSLTASTSASVKEEKKTALDEILEQVNQRYSPEESKAITDEVENIVTIVRTQLTTAEKDKIKENKDDKALNDAIAKKIQTIINNEMFTNIEMFNKLMSIKNIGEYLRMMVLEDEKERKAKEKERLQTPEMLAKQLKQLLKDDFDLITSVDRTFDEAFAWMMEVLNASSIAKYENLCNRVLGSFYPLFCPIEIISSKDEQQHLTTLAISFESYLKKMYWLITGREVVTKDGNAESASLSNAIFFLRKLGSLRDQDSAEKRVFYRHLEMLKEYGNFERHRSEVFSLDTISKLRKAIPAMYVYAALRYASELESVEGSGLGLSRHVVADQYLGRAAEEDMNGYK